MSYLDFLRPPSLFDPSASAYKDWLHVNIFDHASGSVALVNASLHGPPADPRSRAIGTALVHEPSAGWFGTMEIRGLSEAAIGALSIGLEQIGIAVDSVSGKITASVREMTYGFVLTMEAIPATSPVIVEERLPLGNGWISWYAMPRLSGSGAWGVAGQTRTFTDASVYNDHNWGRWHWGDNLGWEWGCFLSPSPGPAFVLSRTTDRDHRSCGSPMLTVRYGAMRRMFTGPALSLDYSGEFQEPLRRLPGALAALNQDRIQPRLPGRLLARASDGVDELTIEFRPRAAAQLVTADPLIRGYSFIHEMPGEFEFSGRMGKAPIRGSGLGIFEHVDS